MGGSLISLDNCFRKFQVKTKKCALMRKIFFLQVLSLSFYLSFLATKKKKNGIYLGRYRYLINFRLVYLTR